MQCSNSRLLSSEGSCLLNELNLNNSLIIAHSTSNQLKACSCARSSTSASSLVFPTLTLVRAILLQAGKAVNNCSFFQIQLSIWYFHPQTLSSFFSRSGDKHSTASRVLPYTSFVLYRFLCAFKTEQSTVEASLFVN